jgi:hypothetical protein
MRLILGLLTATAVIGVAAATPRPPEPTSPSSGIQLADAQQSESDDTDFLFRLGMM